MASLIADFQVSIFKLPYAEALVKDKIKESHPSLVDLIFSANPWHRYWS